MTGRCVGETTACGRAGLRHCRPGGGPLWLQSPHPGPGPLKTHFARTARQCSSWSRAGSRCSPGLRSAAGAPCTLGCASVHTRCYRPTTCSTPSTRRRLWGHSAWFVGTRARTAACTHGYMCPAQQCTHTWSAAGQEGSGHTQAGQRNPRESEEHRGAKTAPDSCVRSPTQTQHKGSHTGTNPG